jgi:hypothetical protein
MWPSCGSKTASPAVEGYDETEIGACEVESERPIVTTKEASTALNVVAD